MTLTSPRPATAFVPHAKLGVPGLRPGAIPRTRLLRRLQREADRRVALVSAPAGYGKSILAAQWAAHDPRPAAWLQVDDADNDPLVLLDGIAHALDVVSPVDPELLEALGSPSQRVSTVVLPLLATELERRSPSMLVLDDVHVVEQPEALRALRLLVELFPAGSQLVLVARAEPRSLRLARLRAAGELATLDAPDLALSTPETGSLAALAGIPLDDDEAAALHDRTEGWAAGVALALLSWDDLGGDPARLPGGERDIAEYLIEEVLERQPAEVRSFMLETSVLERLSAPLCDAVLSRADSGQRLAELASSNMFVVPLDREGRWYRYHHLFAELLRAELERRSPKLVRSRLARAAAWHEHYGSPTEGFTYAHACGDLTRAGRIAWASANMLLATGRIETLRAWARRLTADEIAADTQLALFAGWIALLTGDVATATRATAAAEAGTDLDAPSADGASSLHVAVANLRGTLAPAGIGQMLTDGEFVRDTERAQGGDRLVEGLRMVGTARLLSGRPAEAVEPLSEMLLLSTGDPARAHHHINALGLLSLAAADMGDWPRARRLAREALATIDGYGLGDMIASLTGLTAHAVALTHEGLLTRAEAELDRLVELAPLTRAARWLEADISLRRAEMRLAHGDVARALECEELARNALSGYPDADALEARLEALRRRIASGRDLELTPSELRIVPFLPTHLSLQEIGERVHLSRATVKTHVGAIYRKLRVSGRSQAVDRLDELGLATPRRPAHGAGPR